MLRPARAVLDDVARESTKTCVLGMLLPQTLTMMFLAKAPAAQHVPYEIQMHRNRALLQGTTGLRCSPCLAAALCACLHVSSWRSAPLLEERIPWLSRACPCRASACWT
jgi:hypothetical protein